MGAKKVYLMTGPGTDVNQLAEDFRAALSECGKPSPSVAYVGTASGDDRSLFGCLGLVPYTFGAHGEKEDWAELNCALRLMGCGAVGHGLSNGGAYTADENGNFLSFRNAPALFCNIDGKIERKK